MEIKINVICDECGEGLYCKLIDGCVTELIVEPCEGCRYGVVEREECQKENL